MRHLATVKGQWRRSLCCSCQTFNSLQRPWGMQSPGRLAKRQETLVAQIRLHQIGVTRVPSGDPARVLRLLSPIISPGTIFLRPNTSPQPDQMMLRRRWSPPSSREASPLVPPNAAQASTPLYFPIRLWPSFRAAGDVLRLFLHAPSLALLQRNPCRLKTRLRKQEVSLALRSLSVRQERKRNVNSSGMIENRSLVLSFVEKRLMTRAFVPVAVTSS